MKLRNLRFVWNLWPPFLGLGIAIKEVSADLKKVVVILKKRPWNVNYFGTQYGGAIFAMTDGIHMLMLIRSLPKNYRVWDKAASIVYLKRGVTELHAEFVITDAELAHIQKEVAAHSAIDWEVNVDIFDSKGEVVAKVKRTLSIKLKREAS